MSKVVGLISVVCAFLVVITFGFGMAHHPAPLPPPTSEQLRWVQKTLEELDQRQNDILVYEGRIMSLREAYDFVPHTEWAPVDQDAYDLARREIDVATRRYNSLTFEYNAMISRVDWGDESPPHLPSLRINPI